MNKFTIYTEPKHLQKLFEFHKAAIGVRFTILETDEKQGHFQPIHVESELSLSQLSCHLVSNDLKCLMILPFINLYKTWTLFSSNGNLAEQEAKLCTISGINDITEKSITDGYTRFVFTTHLSLVDLFKELSDKIPFGFLFEGVYEKSVNDFILKST